MHGEIVKSIYIIFKISYISQESFRFCIIKKQLPNTIRGTVPILSDNHRDKIIYPKKTRRYFFLLKHPLLMESTLLQRVAGVCFFVQ